MNEIKNPSSAMFVAFFVFTSQRRYTTAPCDPGYNFPWYRTNELASDREMTLIELLFVVFGSSMCPIYSISSVGHVCGFGSFFFFRSNVPEDSG